MRNRFLLVSVLGISIVLSAIIFGSFFYQSRIPQKSIKVVGVATKRFNSDIIKWRVSLSRSTGVSDLKNGYSLIKSDLKSFNDLLLENGFSEKDITVQPVNTNPIYSQYEKSGNPVGYNIMQNLYIVSADITKLEKIALNPSFFFEKGIILQNSNLEYYFSKLDRIKKELLANATQDAKKRAEAIAKSVGDQVDRIDSARVGVFQITEPYSTEVSDYGVYNISTKVKDITVTMNVSFSLK